MISGSRLPTHLANRKAQQLLQVPPLHCLLTNQPNIPAAFNTKPVPS